MGCDYSVYIGPYIVGETKITSISEKITTCTNPNNNCINHKRSVTTPFCPACGSKVEERDIIFERRAAHFLPNIIYNNFIIDEEDPDIHILRPIFDLEDKIECINTTINDDGPGQYEYTPDEITRDLQEFKNTAKDILKILDQYYKYRISWGVITEASC